MTARREGVLRYYLSIITLITSAALALACTADAQTNRGTSSSGRYEPGASLGSPLGGSSSSSPPLTATLNTARPVPNPAAPTTPRSYQRDYPRESTPLNPPDYRRFDLPGEWRD